MTTGNLVSWDLFCYFRVLPVGTDTENNLGKGNSAALLRKIVSLRETIFRRSAAKTGFLRGGSSSFLDCIPAPNCCDLHIPTSLRKKHKFSFAVAPGRNSFGWLSTMSRDLPTTSTFASLVRIRY